MKRLSVLIALLPVIAMAAPITITWDPYPHPQATMHAECRRLGGTYTEIGAGPAAGTITAESGVNPGEAGECRIWATQTGFQDSPRSGVATFTVPLPQLPQPTGAQAAP